MKIAYCILCHKNPEQINVLLQTLEHENNYFFIHIDAKSIIKNEIIQSKNIFIIDKRMDVKWAQISMVQATLLLFEHVLVSKIDFDYVWLISGQDFPIKSNEHIHNYLESHKGKNFVSIYDTAANSDREHWIKRNEIYYPLWSITLNIFHRVIRRLWVFVTGNYKYTFRFFRRKNIIGRRYYFGSQWFTITFDCMCYILTAIKREPEIIAFYKNTICPDESFFQTIIMNSPHMETVKEYLLFLEQTNWPDCKYHPNDLKEEDFDKIKNSDKLIARKFNSIEVIKKLKIYLGLN